MADLPPYTLFAPLTKSDTDQRIVVGIASTEDIDNEAKVINGQAIAGDVVDSSAIEDALADYMAWANIREMHQPSAVGVALRADVEDGKLLITAKIEDDTAWHKVKTGVYKGFSIGGKILKAALENLPDGRTIRRILKIKLFEISLADRPMNPNARILLWKGAFLMPTEEELLELQKAAANPQKIITMIQAARNACEASGDLDGAALYTQAVALILQAGGSGGEAAEEVAEGEEMDAAAKLAKVGRKINRGNLSSLHRVLKSLLEMMSMAGDETAAKMLKSYTEKAEGPSPDSIAKTAGAELVKGIEPRFDDLKKSFTDSLALLEKRLQRIEEQPVPGGPTLRPVEKVLATTNTNGTNPDDAAAKQADLRKQARIVELRRLANTEVNPTLRAQYETELKALTTG